MITHIVLAVVGLLIHVSKKGIEVRAEGFDLLKYISANPWQTALSPLGTVALFIFFTEFDLMNAATAFAAGYMGNSAADIIGKRANV